MHGRVCVFQPLEGSKTEVFPILLRALTIGIVMNVGLLANITLRHTHEYLEPCFTFLSDLSL